MASAALLHAQLKTGPLAGAFSASCSAISIGACLDGTGSALFGTSLALPPISIPTSRPSAAFVRAVSGLGDGNAPTSVRAICRQPAGPVVRVVAVTAERSPGREGRGCWGDLPSPASEAESRRSTPRALPEAEEKEADDLDMPDLEPEETPSEPELPAPKPAPKREREAPVEAAESPGAAGAEAGSASGESSVEELKVEDDEEEEEEVDVEEDDYEDDEEERPRQRAKRGPRPAPPPIKKGGVIEKPARTEAVAAAKNLTYAKLSEFFHLPISAAARALGICVTLLKKKCRENGFSRWPQRRVNSLDKTAKELRMVLEKNVQLPRIRPTHVQSVLDHVLELRASPELVYIGGDGKRAKEIERQYNHVLSQSRRIVESAEARGMVFPWRAGGSGSSRRRSRDDDRDDEAASDSE
eukprot:tig00000444_g805.t1